MPGVEAIVTLRRRQVHIGRMYPEADALLNITQGLKDVFNTMHNHGRFVVEAILAVDQAVDADGYVVTTKLLGLGEHETTWELVNVIRANVPNPSNQLR